MGLSLEELAHKSGVSKPYLSMIETGHLPSDLKLKQIEETLQFRGGELLAHAHLERAPEDVRRMLRKLLTREIGNLHSPASGDPLDALLRSEDVLASIDEPGRKAI